MRLRPLCRYAHCAAIKDAMPEEKPPGTLLRTLVGLGLIVLLIGGTMFIMQRLRHAAAIQDCVASGRTNCAPITGQ